MKDFTLTFKPSSEKPKYKNGNNEYLLLNPCDGYHIVQAEFDEDSLEFEYFTDFSGYVYKPDVFYVAWAKLPNQIKELHPIFVDRGNDG